MEKNAIQVVGLGGSLRPHSRSLSALQFALQACEYEGASTKLLDIADLSLPLYQPGKDMHGYAGVRSLAEAIATCEVLLVSSPVYAGSLSGAVKNALDFIHDLTHVPPRLQGRVAGVIAVSEITQSATCLAALCSTLSAMGAVVVPGRVGLTGDVFVQEGKLWDPIASDRITALVHDVLTCVRMQRITEAIA